MPEWSEDTKGKFASLETRKEIISAAMIEFDQRIEQGLRNNAIVKRLHCVLDEPLDPDKPYEFGGSTGASGVLECWYVTVNAGKRRVLFGVSSGRQFGLETLTALQPFLQNTRLRCLIPCVPLHLKRFLDAPGNISSADELASYLNTASQVCDYTASHLCGHGDTARGVCINPQHVVFEPLQYNTSRNFCVWGKHDSCPHRPRCCRVGVQAIKQFGMCTASGGWRRGNAWDWDFQLPLDKKFVALETEGQLCNVLEWEILPF